jgi:hypothetical protein
VSTVTITVTPSRGIRSVRVDGQTIPVGQPVDVSEDTIKALEGMPGVSVDVAGQDNPDVNTPDTINEE